MIAYRGRCIEQNGQKILLHVTNFRVGGTQMDWLRNWKKRLLLSVMTGMLAVTLLFGGTKNVEDCSIMAWWGTLYPQFCFERGSQNSANYENTVKQPPKLSFWLAKALERW